MASKRRAHAICVGLASLAVLACSDRAAPRDASPEAATMTEAAATEAGATMSQLVPFVLRTRGVVETADLAASLEARFGPGVQVERLFEDVDPADDPDGMARMYRAAIPQANLPSEHPWDNAYALEEALDLEAAEPDLDSTLAQDPEIGQLCLVDDPPPADKSWSVADVRAVEAWELTPPVGGRRFGEGISVCHPDTGWAEHIELDVSRLDLVRAKNLLATGPANGLDPLDYEGPMLNPGHGTGTGSVIVSEHEQGEVLGVAPRATLVPIRTAKSVVQVFDSDLARAVNYSIDAGCDVISMSLGGRTFFGLQAAVRRAVRNQLIVAAAAGNCVRFVVAPAAYDDTLAIAASNIRSEPWRGSSRGSAVDVSAPGEQVWTAVRRRADAPTTDTMAGQGTSYAVANVAGSAALWLAFHDRGALLDLYGSGATLQEVFRALLRSTARAPQGWDPERFGSGILDVEALLRAELPSPEEFAEVPTEVGESELALLSAVVDRPARELGPLMASLFDTSLVEVDDRLRIWGPELIQMALGDPSRFERLLGSLAGEEHGAAEESAVEDLLSAASTGLRSQLSR